MAAFTLRGRRGTQAGVTMTWEDGKLSGDPEVVAMTRRLAEAHEGVLFVFPGGVRSTHRPLLPSSAFLNHGIIGAMKPERRTGDVPMSRRRPRLVSARC